jgi:hypothetical protein
MPTSPYTVPLAFNIRNVPLPEGPNPPHGVRNGVKELLDFSVGDCISDIFGEKEGRGAFAFIGIRS